MSEANAEQYDWIIETLDELDGHNEEIDVRPRLHLLPRSTPAPAQKPERRPSPKAITQKPKPVEKDEFDELDELFFAFNNKMIEIKDRLKAEKEEMNRMVTSCEFENAGLKLENKELNEKNTQLAKENSVLTEFNRKYTRDNAVLRGTVSSLFDILCRIDAEHADENFRKSIREGQKEAEMETPEEKAARQTEEDVAKMLQDPQETEEDNNA